MICWYYDLTADEPGERLYSSDAEGCLVALCTRCATCAAAAGHDVQQASYQPGLQCEECGAH